MNPKLALNTLAEIMGWDEEHVHQEYRWLQLIARFKYDDYRDFRAGARFIESLVIWLQQFEINDRECAYNFIRKSLVFISAGEMRHLVDTFYPYYVLPFIAERAAELANIPSYCLWVNSTARDLYKKLLRQTLFLGLSDGARIDMLRHANAGTLSNEQILIGIQHDFKKWEGALKKLRTDLNDETAKFRYAFAIDDFVGSGTTLIRRDNSPGDGWTGKLSKLRASIQRAENELNNDIFESDWELVVHHYIANAPANKKIVDHERTARTESNGNSWFPKVHFSCGMTLPELLNVKDHDNEYVLLADKYYNKHLHEDRKEHLLACGLDDLRFGYNGCALPLILEHNTPNNSVALLWAETDASEGKDGHAMRPLFRRRERHGATEASQ